MTYPAKPKLHHPTLPKNKVGFTAPRLRGQGLARCAPAAATTRSRAALIQAFWELDIQPHRVAKLSGIGCSSKTPDYFLGNSHGFNTVHGRMPSRPHRRQPRQPRPDLPRRLRRRRLGLDRPRPVRARHAPRREHDLHPREQRRLRPDQGPVLGHRRQGLARRRGAQVNADAAIDTVSPRAADGRHLRRAQLLAATSSSSCRSSRPRSPTRARPSSTSSAPASPSTTTPARTKSYDYVREHNEAVNRLDFWPNREAISVDYNEGDVIDVPRHRRHHHQTAQDPPRVRPHRPHQGAGTRDRTTPPKGRGRDRAALPQPRLRRPPRPPQYRARRRSTSSARRSFARGRGCWRRSTPA